MLKNEEDEKKMNFSPDNKSNKEGIKKYKNENVKLSMKNYIRLREVFVINSLKKQVINLKCCLKKKEEEIENFKNNLKCAKYSKLEFNYNNNLNSFIKTKKNFENVKKINNDVNEKLLITKEENDKLYLSLNRYKVQCEDLKIKIKYCEDENKELINRNKTLEEKLNFMKTITSNAPSHYSKVSLRQKDNMIMTLRNDIQASADKFKSEKQRLERRIYFMDKDFKKIKEILDVKNEEKKDIEKNVINLKDEGRKYISNLQWMIKIEKELFMSEKKQIYEYIDNLKIFIEKIKTENDLVLEIPEFKLNLPASTCLQEINQHKILKDIERKYEESEKNLNTSLNNQERAELLRKIESPKQEVFVVSDLNLKDDKKELELKQDFDINNNLDNFKIEPIKTKESLMLTALNRNKFVEDNFIKDIEKIENVSSKIKSKTNKSGNMDCIQNIEVDEKLKEDSFNHSKNLLNIDENNNLNNSFMNNSKLRLKNIHNNIEIVDSSKLLKPEIYNQEDIKKNDIKIGENFLKQENNDNIYSQKINNEIDDGKENVIVDDKNIEEGHVYSKKNIEGEEVKYDLENILNEKTGSLENVELNNNVNQEQLNINSDSSVKKNNNSDIEKNNISLNENVLVEGEKRIEDKIKIRQKIELNTQNNLVSNEKQFNENENPAFIENKINDEKEYNNKINNPIKHPSPKKKRTSCQKIGCNYTIKILESEEQVIDIFKPYYVLNHDNENKKIMRQNTKHKTHIMRTESIKKMNSLEKIFTEGIQKNSNFEELLNDPRLLKLYNNLEI